MSAAHFGPEKNKNPDVSTEPLACPFARSLVRLLRIACALRCTHSFARSLACSQAHGKVNDYFGCVFFCCGPYWNVSGDAGGGVAWRILEVLPRGVVRVPANICIPALFKCIRAAAVLEHKREQNSEGKKA